MPDRWRSKKYMAHIRTKPCLICGGYADAHHLTFAEPRAKGRKNADFWCVPVCRQHHDALHNFAGGERTFWAVNGIDPETWAAREFQRWSTEEGSNEHGERHIRPDLEAFPARSDDDDH